MICGAKGGLGVTCVSANLSAAISAKNEAALVSMNRDSGEDLAAWFGFQYPRESGRLIELGRMGTPELVSSICRKLDSRFFLISRALQEEFPDAEELDGFLSLLRRRFDWVIVDAGSASIGADGWMLEKLISLSTIGIVIFSPDPMAIRKVAPIGERFRGAGKKIVGVQNRAISGGAPSGKANWSDLLGGVELLASLSEVRGMKDAILKGTTVPFSDARSDEAAEYLYLAELLENFHHQVEEKTSDASTEEGFQGATYRELKRQLHRRLLGRMRDRGGANYSENRDYLRDELVWLMEDEGVPDVTPGFRERILEELIDSVIGLGPLQDLLDDPEISEIMVNGPESVYVERNGKIILSDRKLDGEEEVRSLIERIVAPLGRRIDESSPLVDARLSDGSRVNAIIPPLSLSGPCLTIRKFGKRLLGIDDLLARGSITRTAADFLRACVVSRLNILISGGTGSGKTTLLNVMGSFLGENERIITIEDAAELKLPQDHVVRLEARPANLEGQGAVPIRDLLKNALRMRPDRIVIGECRGGEALDMLQAMNTGHEGSISTLHANGPRDALARLETMTLMAGMDLPLRAIKEQIALALDIVVQIARMKDGTRRITHIAELEGIEGEVYRLQDIFVRAGEGELGPSGLVPRVAEKIRERGQELPQGIFG